MAGGEVEECLPDNPRDQGWTIENTQDLHPVPAKLLLFCPRPPRTFLSWERPVADARKKRAERTRTQKPACCAGDARGG
eukprot:3158423-Rhodomonas_salina.4